MVQEIRVDIDGKDLTTEEVISELELLVACIREGRVVPRFSNSSIQEYKYLPTYRHSKD